MHALFPRGYATDATGSSGLVGGSASRGSSLQQLAQLDVRKQAGQWARLYRQVQAAEARLRQAKQETPPSSAAPPEHAKQQEATSSHEGTASG